MAAPTPWTARAPSSHSGDCASPPSNDATVNNPMPTANTRRRPRMSPARAPSSSAPPNVRVYAFCTHERLVGEKLSARRIWGRAVMTIVASRMTIR